MKSLVSILAGLLLTVAAFAQKYEPTANWPYMYPDFMDGELILMNKAPNRAKFNIHLNLSKLHYIDRKGKIKEVDTWGVTGLVIGEDKFRFVGGKMLMVMAEAEGDIVVKEPRPNYSAIVKKDGAMGTTGLNSTTTKTFLYNENAINQYNGYLLTDDYKELHAMKDQSERLPVNSSLFLVIGNEQIPANRKSVSDLPGIDKKAFSKFLKSEKIRWNDVEDLVKVLDYITAR